MKKLRKSKVLVVMAAIVILCSGCTKKDSQVDSVTNTKDAYNKAMSKDAIKDGIISKDAVMISVGVENVTYSEALVYILMVRQDYGEKFGSGIWDLSVDEDRNFEDIAKEEIINQITRLKVIAYGAKELDISVDADEEIEINKQATEYLTKISVEDQEKYGITLDIAYKVVYDNFLAEKVFEVVTLDVDTTIPEGITDADALLEQRQDELFSEAYTKWFEQSEIYIVSELWNMIEFDNL